MKYVSKSAHFGGCKVRIFAVHATDGYAAVLMKHEPTLYLFDIRSNTVTSKLNLHQVTSVPADHKWGDIRSLHFHDNKTTHANSPQTADFRTSANLHLSTSSPPPRPYPTTTITMMTDTLVFSLPLHTYAPGTSAKHHTKETLFVKLSQEEIRPIAFSCVAPMYVCPGLVVAATTGKIAMWDFETNRVNVYPNAPRCGINAMTSVLKNEEDTAKGSVSLLIGNDDGSVMCLSVTPKLFGSVAWTVKIGEPVVAFSWHQKTQMVFASAVSGTATLKMSTGEEGAPRFKFSKKPGTALGIAMLLQGTENKFVVPYEYNKAFLIGEGGSSGSDVVELCDLKRTSGEASHLYGVSASSIASDGFFIAHNHGVLRFLPEATTAPLTEVHHPHQPLTARILNSTVQISSQNTPLATAPLPNARSLHTGPWLGITTPTSFLFYSWRTLEPISKGTVGSLSPPNSVAWGGAWCALVYDTGVFVFKAEGGCFEHVCSVCVQAGVVAWAYDGAVLFVDVAESVLAVFPYAGGYDCVVVASFAAAQYYAALSTVQEGSIGSRSVLDTNSCILKPQGKITSISCTNGRILLASSTPADHELPGTIKWRIMAQRGLLEEARSWGTQGCEKSEVIEAFIARRQPATAG